MTLKIPNVGEVNILNQLRAQWGNALLLHLFRNDYAPADTDTIGNYTEANYSGYAAQLINSWTVAVSVGGVATTQANPNTFVVSAGGVGNSIYGYYVTDGSGNLLYAERDDHPPVGMNVPGDNYVVTPKFTFQSLA